MAKPNAVTKESVEAEQSATPDSAYCRLLEDGRFLVDYPGNAGKPLQAVKVYVIAAPDAEAESATDVTLVVKPRTESENIQVLLDALLSAVCEPTRNARRRKTVAIEAEEDLTLRCGKSSITLTKDGKVIVRGTKIVSRATHENKIRGAQISLN